MYLKMKGSVKEIKIRISGLYVFRNQHTRGLAGARTLLIGQKPSIKRI
jgi:hypothetical protein